jgi:hypothetical protein
MTMVNNKNSISLRCYVAPNKFETNAYFIHIWMANWKKDDQLEVWTLDPNCNVERLKDVTITPFPMGHIACFFNML